MRYNDIGQIDGSSFIDKRTVLEVIGPKILDEFLTCCVEAWKKYQKAVQPLMPVAHPRTIANCYRELILEEIRQRIAHQPRIKAVEKYDRFLLEVGERFLIQFKKLGPDFRTSNIPTRTSLDFDLQFGLEGIRLPRVTLGYQPDEFWLELKSVWLVFNIGKENIWFHNLSGDSSTESLPFPMPDEGAADQEERDEQRRRDDREDESEEV